MTETDAPVQQDDLIDPANAAAMPLAPRASLLNTAGAAAAASALLSACGGGGGGTPSGAAPATGPGGATSPDTAASGYRYTAAATEADAARFLQQAQFSSTQTEIASLRSTRYAEWLNAQFASPQGPTGWDWLEARGYGAVDTNNYFFNHYPGDFMIWSQLLSGPDAMRRRVALALSEFFVVSYTTSEFTWRSHAIAHYWDTLVRHAFGNFRQLLEDVTLHPVMGHFLNTKGNQKEDTRTGRVPDENYSREVMQLFTIGLYQLNLDGTVKTGSDGKPLDSYTLDDVSNLARVFTGYDFDRSDGVRITVPGQTSTIESKDFARKPMALDATKHSTLASTFLGTTIPANTPGAAALKTALDTLFNHPNVGPFFARQMIQRLVTSNPSPAYVARVATAFNNNGSGVRGDLRAVWTAILMDDEARDPQRVSDPVQGKLREPMLRFIQWARTFGVTSAAGSWKLFEFSRPSDQLGQSPLRPASVFNFFRPGYVPPGTALVSAQATAPEFQLVNETSVGGYLNFMQGVIRDGFRVNEPTLPQNANTNGQVDIKAAYTAEIALVADAPALVRHLSLVLCAGQLPASTQTLIVGALNAIAATADDGTPNLNRIAAAVFMVMASAGYLIQK